MEEKIKQFYINHLKLIIHIMFRDYSIARLLDCSSDTSFKLQKMKKLLRISIRNMCSNDFDFEIENK